MQKTTRPIGIALVGYGGIGRVHTAALDQIKHIYPRTAPPFALKAVCMRNREKAEAAAREAGAAKAYGEFDELLQDESIRVLDMVTPNFAHEEQITRAVAAGKHIICEKPLSTTADEAERISRAVEAAGTIFGMIFNYRFIPAIMQARQMIEAGELGEIYSFRAEYFHTGYQNPERPLSWRMEIDKSGGGAMVDLGVHVIDLVRYLFGEVAALQGMTETYIQERPVARGAAEKGPVTVDDAAWFNLRLENGAKGSLEVSRFATGTLDDLNLVAYGSRGALRFSLMDSSYLYWYDAALPAAGIGGWTRLETVQRYPDAVLPNPRSVTGWTRYHAENLYRFLKAVEAGEPFSPGVADGLAAQKVLSAAYRAAESGSWIEV